MKSNYEKKLICPVCDAVVRKCDYCGSLLFEDRYMTCLDGVEHFCSTKCFELSKRIAHAKPICEVEKHD